MLYGCPLTLSINGIKGPLRPGLFTEMFPFDGLMLPTAYEGNGHQMISSREVSLAGDLKQLGFQLIIDDDKLLLWNG